MNGLGDRSRPAARSDASELVRLRCRLGWIETVEWAGLHLAEQQGRFSSEGLAVEVVPGGPGARSAAADVADGVVDIGIPSDFLAVVDLVEQGAPLRVVAAVMGASPLGLAWPVANGPVRMEALVGRRIGAGAPADRDVLVALFAAAGLDPDFSFHLIGPGTTELETGVVDAICCSTVSQPPAAARRGVALASATFADLGLPMPADVVVVTETTATRRPELVARFLRALAGGWAGALADPEQAASIAVERVGAPPTITWSDALAEHQAQAPFVRWGLARGLPLLGVDVEELDRTLALLAAARGTTPLRSADLVDLGPLVAARAADGGGS